MNRRTFIIETALLAGAATIASPVFRKPITKTKDLIRIPIMVLDKPNKNNRIYPRAVIEKEMAKYKKDFVDENRALISKQLPSTSTMNLMDTVGVVNKIEIEGDTVFVEASFFSNVNNGIIVETGILSGDLHLRTSGIGSLTKQPDGTNKVGDDYEFIGCFVTNDPA